MIIQAKKHFTLVEIMLALGVCAIGVCSIMVLFPIGVKACRDAAMKTYTANMADEMLHYTQYKITESNDKWAVYISNNTTDEENIFNNTKSYPPGHPNLECLDSAAIGDLLDFKSEADPLVEIIQKKGNWGDADSDLGGNFYEYNPSSSKYKIYQFISSKSVQVDEDGNRVFWGNSDFKESKIDFRCVGLLTKEQIIINPSGSLEFISFTTACRLKLEITWPAEIPYEQREKSTFFLDVFKPNF